MTAGRGTLFDEGPSACPFLALERDRERRADEPDARHRCYATPTPEPRALAHQRTYCLTPTFPACPIFQDWAVRAAARPVPLRPIPSMPPPMSEAEMAATLEAAAEVGTPEDEAGYLEQPSLFEERKLEIKPAPEAAVPPAASPSPTPVTDDLPRAKPVIAPGPVIPPPMRPRPITPPSTTTPRPSSSAAALASSAKSTSGPAASPQTVARGKPTLRREDIVPSWERARYDVPSGDRRTGSVAADWFSRLTILFTALAVISVIVLAVLLVPILLGGRVGATPRPSTVANTSHSPTPSPTASPTPGSTWLTYTVKLGDSLYKIALDFNITYEQLLAANPQITNPNFIRAGDVLNIPPPEFAPPSPSGQTGASASP